MKKSIAYAVSKGLVLAALSQTALADGVTYGITWDDSDQRYHVFMTPDATPAVDRTLSAQVTLRIPHGTLPATFTDTSIELTSAHSGAIWNASSRAMAPTEDTTVDYISFTPTLSDQATFALEANKQQEIFSFTTGDVCLGAVEIMDNDNDPFNNPPSGQVNSMQSNPGNEFSSLMWTADNDFLGIEGTAAVCKATSANNDPVANADSASVEQGGSISIDVLDNDTDANGDNLSVVSKIDGDHGVVTIVNGSSITYVADTSYVGSDIFSYTLSDGKGGSSTATVTVDITAKQATNANPVAVNDSASVLAGSSVDIDVLNNDTDSDSDALTLTAVGQAGKGAVSINNGQVNYIADSDVSGSDSFTYTVSDGKGGEATGTVTVTITTATATDNDGDGLSNDEEAALGTDPDNADSDGDGISDLYEVGSDVSSPVDTDKDDIIDALDEDDDNDTVLTRFENYNGGLPTDDDTDRDGTPDYLDPDDDNDGIPTAQEQPATNGDPSNGNARDTNGDGTPDYLQRPGSFASETQTPIPTLTQWAQILLSMLLGLVALGGFLRKNSGK